MKMGVCGGSASREIGDRKWSLLRCAQTGSSLATWRGLFTGVDLLRHTSLRASLKRQPELPQLLHRHLHDLGNRGPRPGSSPVSNPVAGEKHERTPGCCESVPEDEADVKSWPKQLLNGREMWHDQPTDQKSVQGER